MKKIVLTADYELFLGEKTGSVKECFIEPTAKLLKILEKSNSKMTIFWDILHFYRLLELEETFPELKADRIAIEEQVLEMAKAGHDIQLHLHPHWLDAAYNEGKWNFIYDRFRLHNLSKENNPEDINTILGCVSISTKLIEEIVRKVNPDYKVTSYRAGGYLAEPFETIKEALLKNDIKIDSSVCLDFYNDNEIFSFDFRNYPRKNIYKIDSLLKEIDDSGDCIEIPISTIQIPVYRNLVFTLIRRFKYPGLENGRSGSGSGYTTKSGTQSPFARLLKILTQPKINQLTTDSNFKEKFDYVFKKVPEYSTMILHPKLLNSHTLEVLDNYVSSGKTQFISINDFVNQKLQII